MSTSEIISAVRCRTLIKGIAVLLLIGPMSPTVFSQSEPDDNPKLVVRQVLPSATDSRIDKFSGDGYEHWIYFNPAARDRGQLLVFIPGTGGTGSGAKAFCALAANEGFHAVTMAYPSNLSMSFFAGSIDPDAFQKARENIIYGRPPFDQLDTGVPNCIQNRLHFLLHYLVDHYPQENWQQFLLKKGRFDYRKMILAGQSQGGGHAALMGMQHEVARVLMFGAPKDFNVHFNKPAKWFSGPSATPLNRFFSFVHSKDEGHGCSYAQQLENYRAMKLSPQYPVVNVDDTPAPFQHSRLLTSRIATDSAHTCVIARKGFHNVWKYLLEEPVE